MEISDLQNLNKIVVGEDYIEFIGGMAPCLATTVKASGSYFYGYVNNNEQNLVFTAYAWTEGNEDSQEPGPVFLAIIIGDKKGNIQKKFVVLTAAAQILRDESKPFIIRLPFQPIPNKTYDFSNLEKEYHELLRFVL